MKLLTLFALTLAVCASAIAADKPSPDSTPASAVTSVPSAGFGSLSLLSSRERDLCYTMRTYKVKRTEHLADGESGRHGYSTCEFAANYQIRTTDIRVKDERTPDLKIK